MSIHTLGGPFEQAQPEEKFYTVPVRCANCGKHYTINVPYGKPRPETAFCRQCGCETGRTEPNP
jgi:rRNA maturation endonuclease Nob1